MEVADAVTLAPELVGDEPETADPEALVDVDPDAPDPDPALDEPEPEPEPLPAPEAAEAVSPAETGQTVVDVYTVSVTLPTGQCLTVGAQDVMV